MPKERRAAATLSPPADRGGTSQWAGEQRREAMLHIRSPLRGPRTEFAFGGDAAMPPMFLTARTNTVE